MFIMHLEEHSTLHLSILILPLEYYLLSLHHLHQISLGIELELRFLEDVALLFLLFLLYGHRLKGIFGQHSIDVLVFLLDHTLLLGFGVSGSRAYLVVLLLDLPADPHCANEEECYDKEMLVFAQPRLLYELLLPRLHIRI